MDGSFLVPVAFFAMIAAIVLVPRWLRDRERVRMHETLRMAYEKGQPLPPELIGALQGAAAPVTTPIAIDRSHRDLRTGVVWLAIGLGFVAIGGAFYGMLYYHGGAIETLATFVALGAIPTFIGLAFMILAALGGGKKSRS